jgi:peptidoglycan/LPS O-acetylase OafA/YrhL
VKLPQKMTNGPNRIAGLDFLRGVASLAVCWFHLTAYRFMTPDGPFYEAVRASGTYAWLGVEVFFVISGFVIPYALHRAGYKLSYYPSFILKRLVRLDPPYLVSLAVITLLGVAYAAYAGRAVVIEGAGLSWTRVLLHLGYLNMFFGEEWLNPAFWTLAIEFQYYILMGLLFPLLGSRRRGVRLAALALFAAPAFYAEHGTIPGSGAPLSSFIFSFVFLFVMGIVTFQRRAGLAGRGEWAALLALSAVGALLTVGFAATLAGLFAVAVISLYERKNRVADFFGNISYSLYLLHWPLGHLTLSVLSAKLSADTDAEKALILVAAHAVCFAASYVLFILAERPAQRWSSRIRYGRPTRDPRAQETSGLAPAEEKPTPALASVSD